MIPVHLCPTPPRGRRTALLRAALLLSSQLGLALAAPYCFPATPGASGNPGTLAGTVNTYYPPGAGTYDVSSGSTIPLGSAVGSSAVLAPGDMVLVIQMQCADINAANSDAYGSGVNDTSVSMRAAGDPLVADGLVSSATGDASGYLSSVSDACLAGRYEYVRAGPGTTASSLDLAGSPLQHSYVQASATSSAGRRTFQVIRVPQYSVATLTGNLDAPAWNGSVGGVLALDVAGSLDLAGFTLDVKGKGFRRGISPQRNNNDTNDGTVNNGARPFALINGLRDDSNTRYGGKGEGIAGSPLFSFSGTSAGYPGGDFGRGAPGNAGGGGTALWECCRDNGGGGGGGNGGKGGIGGTGWANNGRPYATQADQTSNTLSSQFNWRDVDLFGFGGEQFVEASASRLVLGGGGGGGDCNNCGDDSGRAASAGASGGGLVMVRAGTLSGGGTLDARGDSAPGQPGNDAAGGGGAGGSVLLLSAQPSSVVVGVDLRGGRGGDSYLGGVGPHGPGGGGGGGVLFHSSTLSGVSAQLGGGESGLTNASAGQGVQQVYYGSTSPSNLTERQRFGSKGGDGFLGTVSIPLAADNPQAAFGALCLPILTVSKITTTLQPLNSPSSTLTPVYEIEVSNAPSAGAATGVQIADVLPSPFTYAGPTTPTLGGTGVMRPSSVDPVVGNTSLLWSAFTIPGGQRVTLSFPVNRGAALGTYQNSATVEFADPSSAAARQVSPLTGASPGANTSYVLGGTVGGSNYLGSSSTAEDIVIESDLAVTKRAVFSGTTTPLTMRTDAQTFEYLIEVENLKAVQASGITVADTNFPAGVSLGTPALTSTPSSPSTGATFNTSTKELSVPNLAPGQRVSLRLPITVSTGLPALTGNTATLIASSPADAGANGSSTANNTQSVPLYFNPVSLTKTVQNLSISGAVAGASTPSKPGDILEYCITASSLLSTPRTLALTDLIPLNTTYLTTPAPAHPPTVTPAGDTVSATSTQVSVSLTSIALSQPKTLCFTVRVN